MKLKPCENFPINPIVPASNLVFGSNGRLPQSRFYPAAPNKLCGTGIVLSSNSACRIFRDVRVRNCLGFSPEFRQRRPKMFLQEIRGGVRKKPPTLAIQCQRAGDRRRVSCNARRAFAITSPAGIPLALPDLICATRRPISCVQAFSISGLA